MSQTTKKSPSLVSIAGNILLGGIALGGAYMAYQNRDKIAKVATPAANRFGAWFKDLTDKVFGAERRPALMPGE